MNRLQTRVHSLHSSVPAVRAGRANILSAYFQTITEIENDQNQQPILKFSVVCKSDFYVMATNFINSKSDVRNIDLYSPHPRLNL